MWLTVLSVFIYLDGRMQLLSSSEPAIHSGLSYLHLLTTHISSPLYVFFFFFLFIFSHLYLHSTMTTPKTWQWQEWLPCHTPTVHNNQQPPPTTATSWTVTNDGEQLKVATTMSNQEMSMMSPGPLVCLFFFTCFFVPYRFLRGLYTPPYIPLNSTWNLWTLCGVRMESAQKSQIAD